MRRILLIVAYDGTDYHGWQFQQNGITIESELNRAISDLTGENVEVIGASRTDAGVHAYGNRAVFDTESTIPADRFAEAVNTRLPLSIRVMESKEVDCQWHPRKCATHKTYEYRIECGRIANPINSRYVWNVPYDLDIVSMNEAAKVLLGEHDFTSFCSVKGTTLTNVRTIIDIAVEELNSQNSVNKEVVIRVKGNGFLYNMVRIIAGTLVEVGRGRLNALQVRDILEAKDRTRGAVTAPPQGLTLVRIEDVPE